MSGKRMLQLTDRMPFGKHRGERIDLLLRDEPGYLSWMLRSGFDGFGKDVTLAIFAWQDANPKEVAKIDKRIVAKKAESSDAFSKLRGKEITGVVIDEMADVEVAQRKFAESRHAQEQKRLENAAWGSW